MSTTFIKPGTIEMIDMKSGGFGKQNFFHRPFVVTLPLHHSMENSLFGYLEMKVHEWVKEGEFDNIYIVGVHDRSEGISCIEKNDKMFNWQRPTAEIQGNDIIIKCFPGKDYVKHYASIIATYLAINGRDYSHVKYILPEESLCWNSIMHSNFSHAPVGDLAIVGYGLQEISGDENVTWEGEGAFSWFRKQMGCHDTVFLGCRHSIWADIAGRVVALLAQKGFKKVIYVGKLGSLRKEHIPNESLATGDTSYIEGEIIRWNNIFENLPKEDSIAVGDHYNCPSVLYETKSWLSRNRSYSFIDPEIGYMAKASLSNEIGFGYMHIISDNLSMEYHEDLSNERQVGIIEKRANLLQRINALIENNVRL